MENIERFRHHVLNKSKIYIIQIDKKPSKTQHKSSKTAESTQYANC